MSKKTFKYEKEFEGKILTPDKDELEMYDMEKVRSFIDIKDVEEILDKIIEDREKQ